MKLSLNSSIIVPQKFACPDNCPTTNKQRAIELNNFLGLYRLQHENL
jgi:hypothetical protein